ncbi:988_t:CDS:2, partial [Racocetra fulgida]
MSAQSSNPLEFQDVSNSNLSTEDISCPRKKRRRSTKKIARCSYVYYFFKEGTSSETVQCKLYIANSKEAHNYITHSSTTNLRNHLKEHEIYQNNYKNFLDKNNNIQNPTTRQTTNTEITPINASKQRRITCRLV